MRKINKIFDNLFNFIPGYIFGLLTFIFGFCGDIIALILSPEYVMWEQLISVLGGKTGGIYLRSGIIISSLFSIPFIIYIGRGIKHETVNDSLRKIAIGIGIFSSVNQLLTGCISGLNRLIISLHGLFVLLAWLGGTFFLIIFSIMMLKNPKFSKFAAFVGFGVAIIFIVFLIPSFITNFCNLYRDICYSFGRAVFTILPTIEWINMFSVLVWYLFNSSYFLYKKV